MIPRVPGLALCAAVAILATIAGSIEHTLAGRAWIEPLVLAILLGAGVRTVWTPGPRWIPGIDYSAKQVLEVAIVLLGLTLDLPLLLRAGPLLAAGIVVAVVGALAIGYLLGKALGLRARLAALVAVGNAICGNSAIAAVAPVIGADPDDIASSIAFTAMPVSVLSGQVGTLVKLTRVLMLGPIVLGFSVAMRRRGTQRVEMPRVEMPRVEMPLGRLVPWFIVGFLLLSAVRATGLVPEPMVVAARWISGALTVVAMVALGLGVDVRVLGRVGGAVTATALGALVLLLGISVALVKGLGIG